MAHNAYIRAGAVWAGSSPLLSTEIATFDARQYQAINGDLGGVWAPSASQIIIGGVYGLRVTGPALLDDADVTITNTKSLLMSGGSFLTTVVGSTVTFDGTVNFTNTLTHVTIGSTFFIDVGGVLTVNGHLGLGAASTLTSAAGSAQSLGGATTVASGGTVTLASGATLTASSGSTIALASGSTTNLAGALNITTGTMTCNAGGTINVSGTCGIKTGGALNHESGSTTTFQSGSTTGIAAGATVTYANTISGLTGSNLSTVGTITVAGAGVLAVAGALNRTGPETLSGAGAYRNVRALVGAASGITHYDGRTFDVLIVPSLAAVPSYLLDDLGPFDYVLITIDAYQVPLVTYSVAIGNELGAGITSMLSANTAQSLTMCWNGTNWKIFQRSVG